MENFSSKLKTMNSQNVLMEKLFAGDRRVIAQSISLIENESAESHRLLDKIHHKIGYAYRIGITGPPGAGKSTLTDRLAKYYREQNKTVGIIAVDPTSPFSGGAVLGDRVRMTSVQLDENVFIRSMATRGSLGGLAKMAQEAGDILDAAGKDIILFETVGVGQSELDIAEAADTTVVVLVPESGDSIQAMKAGLMEIADLFVLNKSDREGADRAVMEIQSILGLQTPGRHTQKGVESSNWTSQILKTVANQGIGITEVTDLIEKHKNYLIETKLFDLQRSKRIKHKVHEIIRDELDQKFWNMKRNKQFQKILQKVTSNQVSPYQIAKEMVIDFLTEHRRSNTKK